MNLFMRTRLVALKEVNKKGRVFPQVVYITGTPGTGKTSIASKLARLLGGIHLELGKLACRKGFTLGFDRERRCAIIDETKLSSYLREVLSKAKRPMVLDAHFSVKLSIGIKPWVFVLRCDPATLARRLAHRGYSERKIRENIWAEILDFCLQEALNQFGYRKIHEVNVKGRSSKAITIEMLKIIDRKQKPQIGVFNWLKKLEREGKLGKFAKR
jgi:adenylate kinase